MADAIPGVIVENRGLGPNSAAVQHTAIYRLLFAAAIAYGVVQLAVGDWFWLLTAIGVAKPTVPWSTMAPGIAKAVADLAIIVAAISGLAHASIGRWILHWAALVVAIATGMDFFGPNFWDFRDSTYSDNLVNWAFFVSEFARNEIFPLLAIVVVLTTPWPHPRAGTTGAADVGPTWRPAARALAVAALVFSVANGIKFFHYASGGAAKVLVLAAPSIALASGTILMLFRVRWATLITIAAVGLIAVHGFFALDPPFLLMHHKNLHELWRLRMHADESSMGWRLRYLAKDATLAAFCIIALTRRSLYSNAKGTADAVDGAGGTGVITKTPVRRRRLIIGTGICGVVLLLWLVPGWPGWHDYPYGMMIAKLHPGMSAEDVEAALGHPYDAPELRVDRPVYRMDGADTMLMVDFDERGVSGWFIFDIEPKNVFEQGGMGVFKVKKSRHYPGPLVARSDFSIETFIYTKYGNGAPIKRAPSH